MATGKERAPSAPCSEAKEWFRWLLCASPLPARLQERAAAPVQVRLSRPCVKAVAMRPAARRTSAPLAAWQAAPHPSLMRCWNNVGALAASARSREVQGRSAVRPSRSCNARQASCESRLFCTYASLDHVVARRYEDLAPARVGMGRRADDIRTSSARYVVTPNSK